MIEIVNRQRKIKMVISYWQDYANYAAAKIAEVYGKSLTVAFVSDIKMQDLNKTFRGKNSITDVLSFPFIEQNLPENYSASDNDSNGLKIELEGTINKEDENFLGDIIISVEQAAQQAKENDLDFEIEIKQLILHGILHLCGFDHETDNGEMSRLELKYRRKLKINF